MTTRDDEPLADQDEAADLRGAFAVVRSEDAAGAPPFEAVLAASRRATHRRRPWLMPLLTGTVAAGAVAIAVLTVARRSEPPLPGAPSIEDWTAPTDFLLQTPGIELLETVPSIGEMPAVRPLDGLDESVRPENGRSVSP